MAIKQDKFISALQQEIAQSLSAVALVLDKILPDQDQTDNLRTLSDACQILTNVHHSLSVHRRYRVLPFLNADCKKIVNTLQIDECLFGKAFNDVFKNEQLTKKTSQEIKKRTFKLPATNIQRQNERRKESSTIINTKEQGTQSGATSGATHTRTHTSIVSEPILDTLDTLVGSNSLYAGLLSKFYSQWNTLTTDSIILNWVKGIKIPFETQPRQLVEPKLPIKGNDLDFHRAINNLLAIGAVSKCKATKGQFLSSYFLVKKPDGNDILLINKTKEEAIENTKFTLDLLQTLGFRKNNKYSSIFVIPQCVKNELLWWQQNIGRGREIKPRDFNLEIYSDASKTGWGAFCLDQKCHGFWDLDDQQRHINFLEIKAAFYAVKCFTKFKDNLRVLLRIDNKTAISCINRGGSVRFKPLNEASTRLWKWCEERNIFLFASYISSRENVEADEQSRSKTINTEYEIDHSAFRLIVNGFGLPTIDSFATRLNAKCSRYISWFPDPDCFSVDAFTMEWHRFYFYAFPPFALVTRAIEKIIEDRATGILTKPSPSSSDFPGGRQIIRTSFLKKAIPADTIPLLISSISDSTLKQYSGCYRKYWRFCKERKVDPYNYNLDTYLSFLTNSFNNGLSYSVINSYRSALNLIFNPLNKADEGTIIRFLRGVYNKRPSVPKYCETWNPDSVLKVLESWYPLENLSLERLSYKLVTLMALTSASRVNLFQTLSEITRANISTDTEGIQIKITERVKTSGPNRLQPLLNFPYFRQKPELCVASTIEFYIKVTKNLIGEDGSLIITHKKPYHTASSQTISRWIKNTLRLGGIDTGVFSSHSVRHASTSPYELE
ncbi:hypothetical protein NQ315_003372 [Exocentrus adspersus]|uniref:Tyr recombinase domain-containing protein n=1 Tax=Exocentrus adspersus TaxID=1586481 RepID=A0AAV8VA11_9CUCU|nr:hypothetical protein NQ315_003372 [Exocentrus adspersus]